MTDLPNGWIETTLGQVADWGSGGTPKAGTAAYYGGSIPWAVIGDLTDHTLSATRSTITEVGLASSNAKVVSTEVVLIAMYGSIGKLGLPAVPMATNQAIAFARPVDGVLLREYLFYYLMYARRGLTASGKGAAQQNISQTILKAWPIPLAPIREQERIVVAIEEEFSRLDAAVMALERVQQNLKRLRSAVLHAATTGRLTAKKPPETAEGFPSGWKLCTPDNIAAAERHALTIGPFGSSLKVSDYTPQGVPLIFVRQVRSAIFEGRETRFISEDKADQLKAHNVRGGDVLITKMGEPPGDATVYPRDQPDAVITADVIKLSPRDGVIPEYVAIAINSKWVRDQFRGITRGVAQQKVSLARFRNNILIPVPPTIEQERIVEEVTRLMQEIDRADASIKAQLARAASLRAAILRNAFSGRLVPQDPSDEAAHVVPKRITTERLSNDDRKVARARKPRQSRQEVTA